MGKLKHEMSEQQAQEYYKNVPGKYVDPVLGNYLVDGIPNNAPRLRQSRVTLGTVPQRNHKVQRER